MKIAIHDRKGSFSDRWIKYCQINKVPYKVVDCNASDIVSQDEKGREFMLPALFSVSYRFILL